MYRKMSERRRGAFLKALAESGNVTLAAERAKVSRSWVLKQRKGEAGFDAECAAAIAGARASFDRLRTSEEGSARPASGWGFLDGAELVVRGTNGRRLQIARARERQITPRVERRLLQVLAATCNGNAACAEAGVSKSAAWNHRRRWPGFERKWQEAVTVGWLRLKSGLTANAINLFSGDDEPPELPMPPMTFAQALHLLHMHKYDVFGTGKAPGRRRRPPPAPDE